MTNIFTKHAIKRSKKRNVGTSRIGRLVGISGAQYLGNNKYQITKSSGGKDVTVVFKKEGGKRIILTTWKR